MGFGVELHEYVRIAQSRTQPICWFHDQTGFHQQTSKVSRYHEDKSHNGQSSFPNAPLAAAPRPRHGSPRLPRPAARYLSRFVPVARPSGNRQFPLPPRFRSLPQTVCLTACSLLVSLFPLPTYAHPRSAADVPEPGPYIHFLSTLSIGDSLRFNNPFRLSHQLGPSGESLSRTPALFELRPRYRFRRPQRLATRRKPSVESSPLRPAPACHHPRLLAVARRFPPLARLQPRRITHRTQPQSQRRR